MTTETNNTYYAIRLGFGSEGHGNAILVAKGNSADECESNADSALQDQFSGLWTSKKHDTYIGRRAYLNREFPEQAGCTTVDEAISEADLEASFGPKGLPCGCPGTGHVRSCPGFGLE